MIFIFPVGIHIINLSDTTFTFMGSEKLCVEHLSHILYAELFSCYNMNKKESRTELKTVQTQMMGQKANAARFAHC